MTDIVDRLRLFVPHCEDTNDYLEDELLFLKAADEIERLRGVFNKMADVLTNKELTDWQILEQIEDLTRAEIWR